MKTTERRKLRQAMRAAKKSPAGRAKLIETMKAAGLTELTLDGWSARLVKNQPLLVPKLKPVDHSYAERCLRGEVCSVTGCSADVLAKSLCQRHYGRARRGQPLDVEPRRGLVQLVIHVEPELKRWLKKTARRDKVSVSQRASMLLQSEKDNLSGKSPF